MSIPALRRVAVAAAAAALLTPMIAIPAAASHPYSVDWLSMKVVEVSGCMGGPASIAVTGDNEIRVRSPKFTLTTTGTGSGLSAACFVELEVRMKPDRALRLDALYPRTEIQTSVGAEASASVYLETDEGAVEDQAYFEEDMHASWGPPVDGENLHIAGCGATRKFYFINYLNTHPKTPSGTATLFSGTTDDLRPILDFTSVGC